MKIYQNLVNIASGLKSKFPLRLKTCFFTYSSSVGLALGFAGCICRLKSSVKSSLRSASSSLAFPSDSALIPSSY